MVIDSQGCGYSTIARVGEMPEQDRRLQDSVVSTNANIVLLSLCFFFFFGLFGDTADESWAGQRHDGKPTNNRRSSDGDSITLQCSYQPMRPGPDAPTVG